MKKVKSTDETKYPSSDLARGAKNTFAVRPYIVKAALKAKGLTEATVDETQAAIEEILGRKEGDNG